MQAVTVHSTRATNTLTARATESESRVKIFLDVEQGIQVHRRDLLQVNVVADILGLVSGVFRVILVDEEALHGGLLRRGQVGIVLYDVVGIEVAFHSGSHAFEED